MANTNRTYEQNKKDKVAIDVFEVARKKLEEQGFSVPQNWTDLSAGEKTKQFLSAQAEIVAKNIKTSKTVPSVYGKIEPEKLIAMTPDERGDAISANRWEARQTVQSAEDEKRRQAIQNGTWYEPKVGIMESWYEDEFKRYESRIKKEKETTEEKGQRVKLLGALVQGMERRYAATGLDTDLSILNRGKQMFSEGYTDYEKSYNAYGRAVDGYNATVKKYDEYRQKENAALDAWRSNLRQPEELEREKQRIEKQIEVKEQWKKKHQDKIGLFLPGTTLPEEAIASKELVGIYDKEIAELRQQMEQLDSELYYSKQYSYMGREDFEKNSQYKSKPNGKEVDVNGYGRYTEMGYDDPKYEYINGNTDVREMTRQNRSVQGLSQLGVDESFLDEMTEKEVAIFNYIYATEGKDEAYEYIDYLRENLTKRQRETERTKWKKHAKEHKIASSIESALMAPAKILSAVAQTMDYADDGKIDENAGYNKFSYIPSDIRASVSEDMGGFGKWLYNTGMSGLDSVVNMAASGGNALALSVFSYGGAAADTTIQAKKRGLSDGQALALGVVAGAAEALTEKIGIDALLNVRGAKNVPQYILRTGRAEALEESITNVANLVGDIMIAGGESEFLKSIEEYKKQGESDGWAVAKTVGNQLLQMGSEALAGFLTGSATAGSVAIVNSAVQARADRAERKASVAALAADAKKEFARRAEMQPMEKKATASGGIQDVSGITSAEATQGVVLPTAETAGQGIVLPTAKETMGRTTAAEYGEKDASFRIGRTVENKPFVEVEEDILDGIPEEEWTKTVKQNLKEKFPEGIIAGNNTINIDNKSRKEMTYSGYMKWLYNNEPDVFADKLRATNNADEIVLAATNWVNEARGHERNDNIESFARGNTLIKIGGRAYLADVVVATRNNGNMLLYDILNLSPTSITEKETDVLTAVNPSPEAHRSNTSVSNKSIPQTASLSQENTTGNVFGGNVLPTAKEAQEQMQREQRAAKAETETERTGILLGVSDEVIREAVSVSKALDVDVLFYRDIDGEVEGDLGYYNHNNGKIYLNADIKNPASFILGHEMIHHIQLTKGYLKFADAVLKKIQQDGGDLDAMRKNTAKRYKKKKVVLTSLAKIDQEIIAEYAQEHLFTNEADIISVVNTDQETGHAIKRFLDNVLAKLGNKNARERAFVARARSLYAKALRENVGIQNQLYGRDTARVENAEARTAGNQSANIAEETRPQERFAEETRAEMESEQEDATRDYTEENMPGESDTAMDILEAERSMAGESMLYDDGRQYAIEREKGVANEEENNYNNTSNIGIGGAENGRKVAGDRYWRLSQKYTGKQTGENIRRGRKNQTGINTEGDKQRRGGAALFDKDSEGRKISKEDAEEIRGTKIINEKGNPILTRHFTPEMDFFVFEKGDVGFHYGTEEQAINRANAKEATKGRIFLAYINSQNPLQTKRDYMNWHANSTALNLWNENILSDSEKDEVISLCKWGLEYNDPASVRLRAILEEKGYDSIKYPNGHEGAGESYIVFYDSQLVKTDIEEVEISYTEHGKIKEVQKKNTAKLSRSGDSLDISNKRKNIEQNTEAEITLRAEHSTQQEGGEDVKVDERQYAINKDAEWGGVEPSSESERVNNLPKKAQTALRQTENRLAERTGEILGVPKHAQRGFLQGIIRGISEDYLKSGRIDRAKVDALFEEAYQQGVVVDAEYFEQYKHIRDHLRNTQLTISEEDRSSIADFGAFRKSAFGKLRIVNEGGLPVDVAYAELTEMAPELFPEDITHPADQLQHMYEVVDGIRKTEQTLDEAYGDDAGVFKEAARDEFHAEINSATVDFKRVKHYAEDRSRITEERETEKSEGIESREDLYEAYRNLKTARRNLDKVKRKALLTEGDEIRVGQLLRREIRPMDLNPETENVKDILAVYKAKQEYESYAKRIREWNEKRKEGLRAQAQEYLANIRKWKDKTKFGGLRYSIETMERNFRDVMGEDAEALIAEYITPVHKAQAKSTILKNEMRDRVRNLQLSRKVEKGNLVSEAHAVQLLGEAEDNIAVLKVMPPDAVRDGKTLADWEDTVAKLRAENKSLDFDKIRKAVETFREIYDTLFEQMNETRVRNGYEPVNYRRGYFPHFQPGDEGVLAQFGRILGIDTSVSALPTTINGMTHIFRPGIQWLGNTQKRIGFSTVYDAVEGFDKYIEGVADIIYQTDNIQKLRALAREIRYAASDEGIKKQVDQVENRPDLTREEKDALIQEIYKEGKFALGNFVVELDEYTNLLANKKSRGDREMERKLGREWYNLARRINSNVAANMTALNIPSWLTNFIPLTQAWGLTDTRYLLKGMYDTVRNTKAGDGFVTRSTFLTNRRGADPLVKAWEQGEDVKNIFGKAVRGWQKGVDKLSGGMELVDNFTSEAIVRAKYYQNIGEGMSEAAAMDDADAFAAGVMADRSKGAMPTAFYETNPLKKLFTQFQIEVNNQYRYVFKDVPRAIQEKGVAALAIALTKILLGAWLYNELYELLFGRRAATDPIGILNDAAGDFTGYNLPSLLDIARGKADFKEEDPGAWKGVSNMAKNIGEELPFVGGVVFGGGRVPLSSAMPDMQNVGKAIFNGDWDGKKRLATLGKELGKPLYYAVLPGGGGQVKKIAEGAEAAIRGGSYTTDAEGNDVLQYPIYNDGWDAPITAARAMLFGKSTLPTAKDWVDGGFGSLSAKDTEAYQALLKSGAKGEDAFAAVQAVKKAAKSNDKRDAIRISGLSEEGKKTLYRTKVSDTRDEDIKAMEDAGFTFDEFLLIQNQYTSIDNTDAKAGTKAVNFSHWLNSQPYTKRQKDTAKAVFQYWSGAAATAGNYDKFVDAGLTDEKALKLKTNLDSLEPEEGKEEVSNLQKYRTVATATLTDDEKMAALSTLMGESEYTKLQVGRAQGVTPIIYVTFREKLLEYDENGNGVCDQKEVTKAIRAMAGGTNLPRHDGTSFNLTNKQKAALWQMANKSWKPNKNPFDTSVGTQVYNALNEDD